MSWKDSSPWPSIHNMLNGWLCHFSCSIWAFSFSITPRQSALILTQPTFHFLFFFYFLTLWHPSSPFPVFPTLTRSAVSGPGGAASGTFKSLFISEAILRHLVPHGQFVTMQNARRCPWGWPVVIALPDTRREKKKETARETEKKKEWSRGRMNLTKALKHIRPTQQSQGTTRPGCQHLSLVKCRLSDNVTLITKSPDSDFLPFYV